MKEKYCINSVASFKQINSSAMNKSSTNQCTKCYNHRCEKSTYGGDYVQHRASGAGIGYGTRSDFFKISSTSPACTQYNMTSGFDQNKRRHRGNSMGLSRENVSFNQYISKQKFQIPNSTKYQYEKFYKFRSPSFSLRQKTKLMDRSLTIDPQLSNPGPGAYIKDVNNVQHSKFSKIAYGTSKSNRFSSSDNGIPGVGLYKNTQPISNSGKYVLSKYLGGTQAKFGRQSRATFLDEAAKIQKVKPGPGFYKAPSQFGQYDGQVYNTALTRFSRKNN